MKYLVKNKFLNTVIVLGSISSTGLIGSIADASSSSSNITILTRADMSDNVGGQFGLPSTDDEGATGDYSSESTDTADDLNFIANDITIKVGSTLDMDKLVELSGANAEERAELGKIVLGIDSSKTNLNTKEAGSYKVTLTATYESGIVLEKEIKVDVNDTGIASTENKGNTEISGDSITKETTAEKSITPTKPVFDKEKITYTIPTQEGVEYTVDGEVVKAGTYEIEAGKTVIIEAVAKSGYTLANNVVTMWTYTNATEPEDEDAGKIKQIEPKKPVIDEKNYTFTIPSQEGVEYAVNGTVYPSKTYSIPKGKTLKIEARAKNGYILKNGSEATWTIVDKRTPDATKPIGDKGGSTGTSTSDTSTSTEKPNHEINSGNKDSEKSSSTSESSTTPSNTEDTSSTLNKENVTNTSTTSTNTSNSLLPKTGNAIKVGMITAGAIVVIGIGLFLTVFSKDKNKKVNKEVDNDNKDSQDK